MAWDDAKKAKVVKMYLDRNPSPDTSIEIVKEIAEEVGETPNGVRMILSKAEAYIKSTPNTSSTSGKSASTETKIPKVGKADKIARLSIAIQSAGMVPDNEILEKLTGKAADYFAQVVEALVKVAEAAEKD